MRPTNAILGALAIAGALAMAGCRGETADAPPRQILPDLDDQLRYNAQSESSFFADGRSQRVPPEHTVAFGRTEHTAMVSGYSREGRTVTADFSERDALLRADDRFSKGVNPTGSFVADIPVPVTRELIELGQENYNIYCIVCHGGLGEGDGQVGQRWSYTMPSLQDPAILKGGSDDKGDDGYIYDKIRNGVANPGGAYPLKMPSYANKVTEHESWAIVAYIRTLQAARNGTVNDLPDRMRLKLDSSASAPNASPSITTNTEASS